MTTGTMYACFRWKQAHKEQKIVHMPAPNMQFTKRPAGKLSNTETHGKHTHGKAKKKVTLDR